MPGAWGLELNLMRQGVGSFGKVSLLPRFLSFDLQAIRAWRSEFRPGIEGLRARCLHAHHR